MAGSEPYVGPVMSMIAPRSSNPNYAVGWHHYAAEDTDRATLDGIFWIAVKGEVNLRGVMPGCEPEIVRVFGSDNVWTVLEAPHGQFWHETESGQCHDLMRRFAGQEVCVMVVAIAHKLLGPIIKSDHPFCELPPLFQPGAPDVPKRVMSWTDCAEASWNEPVDLSLDVKSLSDKYTYTMLMSKVPRVTLTPTLTTVLRILGTKTINIGMIEPSMKNELGFVVSAA